MALFAKGKTQDDPLALLQAGEFKKAIKLIEAKLKRNPNDPSLRWRLAEAYEGAGRAEDAAAIYREEAEGALASGDRPKAVALFRKAAKLAPSDEALAKRVAGLDEANSQSGVFSFDLDALASEPPREVSSEDAALLMEAFPGLDPNEVMELLDLFGRKDLKAGDILLHEGEQGETVYLLTKGRLVARAEIGGEMVELATLARGDVLGEVAFLNHVPRTATVEATEPSTLLEMPGAAARQKLESLPQVRERLERLIAERVERTISVVKARLKPLGKGQE
ncbi:MAG: cyclic nucleotide-binding domain-containing protein [Acidobacteria bacterium]|jgi:CRP-like cAMP-binding protein|nr:cyclic nucleotide-binding domain-containing protein [Acidobacteriota bacterium]